jgi:hypothetical protein
MFTTWYWPLCLSWKAESARWVTADIRADNLGWPQNLGCRGGLGTPVNLHYRHNLKKGCIQRSKMNFNSMSSRSMISVLIGSWVKRIRTCSIFTRSRCSELSSLSSNAIKFVIWTYRLTSISILSFQFQYLWIFLACERPNDEVGCLSEVLGQSRYQRDKLYLMRVGCIDMAWLGALRRICQVSNGGEREGRRPCENIMG